MQTYEDLVERHYENLMRRYMVVWKNIRRWRGKPKPKREDVLMHTFKECMNTVHALSLEKNSDQPIDEVQVFVAKLYHDIGEGLLGCDIPFNIKNDPRLHGIFEEIENDERIAFLNQLPPQTRDFLNSSLRLLADKKSREGKLCDSIEYYGYITFAVAEIKTESKSNKNVLEFNEVINKHYPHFCTYEKTFEFVKKFKELYETRNLEKIPEFVLRDILDVWCDPQSGRAWPSLETNESILERTLKTTFLASMLIPQEIASGKRFNGYKVLLTSLVHKLDKVTFPILSPRLRQNKKLRRYERAIRQIQKEHMLCQIEDYSPETRETITQAYLMEQERDSIEGRFFDAIKKLSYILFAHHEWSRGKIEFRQVFENCDAELLEYSKEFKSIAETYLPVKADFEKKEKDSIGEMKAELRAEWRQEMNNLRQDFEKRLEEKDRENKNLIKENAELEKRLKKLEGKK